MRVVYAHDETYPWAGLASRRPTLSALRYFARENAWTDRKRRDNALLRRAGSSLAPIVTCASHAASHDCTLYERIFLKCLSYSLQSMQRMRTLRYFYRRFYFLLISRKKTQILNNFHKSYILSFCYFSVKTNVLQINNLRPVRAKNNNILENY